MIKPGPATPSAHHIPFNKKKLYKGSVLFGLSTAILLLLNHMYTFQNSVYDYIFYIFLLLCTGLSFILLLSFLVKLTILKNALVLKESYLLINCCLFLQARIKWNDIEHIEEIKQGQKSHLMIILQPAAKPLFSEHHLINTFILNLSRYLLDDPLFINGESIHVNTGTTLNLLLQWKWLKTNPSEKNPLYNVSIQHQRQISGK